MDNGSKPSHLKFVDLVENIYRERGEQPPEIKADPMASRAFDLTVEDIPCVIFYDPSVDEEGVAIFCHFGAVPKDNTVAILSRLLAMNLLLAGPNGPTLGLDEETGEIIYTFNSKLDEITAPSALQALVLAAEQAKRWRDTYFLEEAQKILPGQSTGDGAWVRA